MSILRLFIPLSKKIFAPPEFSKRLFPFCHIPRKSLQKIFQKNESGDFPIAGIISSRWHISQGKNSFCTQLVTFFSACGTFGSFPLKSI